MKIEFQNVQSQHIKDCFYEAYKGFPEVWEHRIVLRKRRMRQTTMQAQPIFNLAFFNKKKRHYRIDFSNNMHLKTQVRVHELPAEVLVGWFAHELGHVVDYLPRTASNMIKFGIGYLLYPNFRIGAERKADIFAIKHGFAEAIISTKKFILEKSQLPNEYKKRIELYYMSADEVALMVQKEEDKMLKMDKLI